MKAQQVLPRKATVKFAKMLARSSAVWLGVAALTFAVAAAPAEAGKRSKSRKSVHHSLPDTANGEPMTLVISLGEQKVDVYRGTERIASSTVSSGMRGYATKAGVFSILEKRRYHHSNMYSGAPMPWMQRLTWSGTALHGGVVPGYPASHGCVRLPFSFAPKLFSVTTVGENVVVAQGRPEPVLVEHKNLFQPAPLPSAPVVAKEPAKQRESGLGNRPGFAAAASRPVILARAEVAATDTNAHRPNAETGGAGHAGEETAAGEAEHAAAEPSLAPRPQVHAIGSAAGSEKQTHAIAGPSPDEAKEHAARQAAEVDKTEDRSAADERAADEEPGGAASVTVSLPEPSPVRKTRHGSEPPSVVASAVEAGARAAGVEAAEPRSEAPLRVLITRRTKRDRLVHLQRALSSLGYLEPLNFDGTFGRATITAIKAFQKANDMPETGAFTDDLAKKVFEVASMEEPPVGHLFVRQEFNRVFDLPISFRNPDKPLGTHLYTALKFEPGDTRARWIAFTVEEAERNPLDRIEIPDDVRQKISQRLTPGSSLIVADTAINTASLPKGADFLVWAKQTPTVTAKANVTRPRAQRRRTYTRRRTYRRPRTTTRRYYRSPLWSPPW